MFVYEEDDKLCLGAGIDPLWFDISETISVENMPVYGGAIDYSVKVEGKIMTLEVKSTARPAGGFVFLPFDKDNIVSVTINEIPSEHQNGKVAFASAPAKIIIEYSE